MTVLMNIDKDTYLNCELAQVKLSLELKELHSFQQSGSMMFLKVLVSNGEKVAMNIGLQLMCNTNIYIC